MLFWVIMSNRKQIVIEIVASKIRLLESESQGTLRAA